MMTKGHLKAFTTFFTIKKIYLNEFAGHVFSRRIPWEFIIGLLDVLKNEFAEVDEAGSRCWKAKQTHFLQPGLLKKRLLRIRLSDFLSRRIALTTQNQPLDVLKKEFGEFDELMFKGLQRSC
jgi:hypothetical protein